jgi:aminopeptidase N
MREGTAPLIRREDYAAPPFWIRKVDLTFDLDPPRRWSSTGCRSRGTATSPPGRSS